MNNIRRENVFPNKHGNNLRILYERLADVPPTPGRHPQELPSDNDPVYVELPLGPPEHARVIDPNDHALQDYLRSNPNARIIPGPNGGVIGIVDPSGNTSRGHPVLPPHGIPLVQDYRTESGSGTDAGRQLPPLPAIRESHTEPLVSNSRSSGYHASTQSTASSHHSHNPSSHHSRVSSSRQDLDQLQGEPVRLDTLPPVRSVHSRSSSLSGDGQGESRSRRPDLHDISITHGHRHPHPHAQVPEPNLPPSPQQVHSPTHGRTHNHQRVGPGVHLHRQVERDPETTRQLMRERDIERERERERAIALRMRLAAEEEELRNSGEWQQEDPRLGAGGMARGRSRSDTPGSGGGGGSGVSSRPASGQSYEQERSRPHANRVADLLVSDQDPYYDSRDHRMAGPDPTRGYPSDSTARADSRKRSRHDMEIDEEDGRSIRSPVDRSGANSTEFPLSHETRGPKRPHPDDEAMTQGHVSSVRDEKPMDQDD